MLLRNAVKDMKKGTVFNIQKMSIHDGPGIRTTVFLKGCPLRCIWCSNPESQKPGREIACFPARCVSCGYCAEVCPKGIIESKPPYGITSRENCDLCEICVKECCTNAKKAIGEEYETDALLSEILKDKSFYDSSGGGVTFSGGEPLLQHEFLTEILKECHEKGVHTAIETTGYAKPEVIEAVISHLDLIFMDIKHMDSQKHRDLTGVSNEQILENLSFIAENHKDVIVRIPVIPGRNDSDENICQAAAFVAGKGIKRLELLPYHNLGEVKYGQLGKEYALSDVKTPSDERMDYLLRLAQDAARKEACSGFTEVRIENSVNA